MVMDPQRFRSSFPSDPKPTPLLSKPLPQTPQPSHRPKSQKTSGYRWVALILVIIVIAGLAGWAYVSVHHKTKPQTKTYNRKSETSRSGSINSSSNQQSTPAIPTTPYTASAFNTSFNYPSNWTVINNGTASINIDSPAEDMVAANGNTVLGQIEFTLAKTGSLPPAFTTQSVAVMTSQKITFTSPSTTQAAQSYISFVQYPTTTIVGGLDGIYLSGNYGYQKYQAIPASNLDTVNPLVYVSFYTCQSQACPVNTRSPLTITSTDWNNSAFSAPILTTLKSFSFD